MTTPTIEWERDRGALVSDCGRFRISGRRTAQGPRAELSCYTADGVLMQLEGGSYESPAAAMEAAEGTKAFWASLAAADKGRG
jgi:hypothetical protein